MEAPTRLVAGSGTAQPDPPDTGDSVARVIKSSPGQVPCATPIDRARMPESTIIPVTTDGSDSDSNDDNGGGTGADDNSRRYSRNGSSLPQLAAAAQPVALPHGGPEAVYSLHRPNPDGQRGCLMTHESPVVVPRAFAPSELDECGDDDVAAAFKPFLRVSPPWSTYEYVRTALCVLILLPFRLAFLGVAAGLLWLIAKLAMVGMHDGCGNDDEASRHAELQKPPTRWHRLLVMAMPLLVRALLFVSFGVYRIKTQKRPFPPCCEAFLTQAQCDATATGDKALSAPQPAAETSQFCDTERGSRDTISAPAMAPHALVSNHLGYLDICALFVKYRGSFVAKGDIEKMAIVGPVARAIRCLFIQDGKPLAARIVERMRSTKSCRLSKSCARCSACLIIFPEGTTTNGTAMIPFRTGAFLAGLPVLPICIQFPHKHFNPTWETILLREHLFRTMTQLWNDVVVTELPVYVPDVDERADARLYASRVAAVMAKFMELPIVPVNRKHKLLYHSYVLGKVTDKRELLTRADVLRSEDELLQYVLNQSPPRSTVPLEEDICVSLP